MIEQRIVNFAIKLNSANAREYVDVWGWELARLYSVKRANVTWATADFDIKHSFDRADVFALDTAQTLGPGGDTSVAIDVTTIRWLALVSKTVEGSGDEDGDIYCILEREVR